MPLQLRSDRKVTYIRKTEAAFWQTSENNNLLHLELEDQNQYKNYSNSRLEIFENWSLSIIKQIRANCIVKHKYFQFHF